MWGGRVREVPARPPLIHIHGRLSHGLALVNSLGNLGGVAFVRHTNRGEQLATGGRAAASGEAAVR